ncbi:hypothetical protein [Nocardia abscessus]|uniref:hypothetical protein n=1 Tax=Nocardia abscessus TaxID=120957 RepID=UPI0002F7D683|nr:hypothetical protein [Nocardia abscessus]MCC3333550.1 hypothetical protein [Nocardia abscessus]
MTETIKPIETRYGGCRFRSRIEARWARFFDYLGIGWEYEPQGFDLPSGPYLPDFLLDLGDGVWWEVKGAAPTPAERDLCWELLQATARQVYLVHGGIPRDALDPPRIEHAGGTPVRWFIRPGVIGFIPHIGTFDQTGTNHPLLVAAFRAARSARFEFGESE